MSISSRVRTRAWLFSKVTSGVWPSWPMSAKWLRTVSVMFTSRKATPSS